MSIFIQGIGSVSAQKVEQRKPISGFKTPEQNPFPCAEPDYTGMIAPMQLRRMSKAVRIGIASSLQALKDANVEKPNIITLGTSYGCLADTSFFLKKMVQQEETMLTPTSFIQSTHNTVSGQIALQLGCHGTNFTFVHSANSFEHSLQDAMMWLKEKQDITVLAGGIDELTEDSFNIISRFGTYKKEGEDFWANTEGTHAGEGSNMFVLSAEKNENSYAELLAVETFVGEEVQPKLLSFLEQNNVKPTEIDVCFAGLNGDIRYDEKTKTDVSFLQNESMQTFKNFCGEYPTSSAFALMMACNKLKYEPSAQQYELVYNHYKGKYHSFILLKKA